MMSPPEEDSTSVLDLELIAQEELKKRKRAKAAKEMQQSVQAPPPSPPESHVIEEKVELPPEAIAELPAEPIAQPKLEAPTLKLVKKRKAIRKKRQSPAGTAESRQVAKKHNAERKMLQKNLNEMTKKRERDIKDLMEEILKEHYTQVDKERLDYLSVLSELKDTIAEQSKEVTKNTRQVVTTAASDEVERMVNWFHDEFMKELDKKNHEYEDLKANSEMQVNKMSEESGNKSQHIMMLDEKIKQLASHLPDDLRRELFAELGLQHLEPAPKPPEPKRERKGVFSRLSQLFKRAPKKSKPAPPPKKKQSKNQKRRPVVQEVVATA